MSDTARMIYAEAALGSLVAFADGTPRPPDRFRRKLRDWETRNGRGRLVGRSCAWRAGGPDSFTLHMGDYGSDGLIVLIVNRTYATDSTLTFSVEQPPAPGTVQVITERDGREELVHRCGLRPEAEAWAARNSYRDMRIVVVGETTAVEAIDALA